MDAPPKNMCNDWMMVGGHCHYANHKYWFQDLKLFNVMTVDQTNGVHGIGTVHLKVKCNTKTLTTKTLVLRNVLYIPNAICNGIDVSSIASKIKTHEGKSYYFDHHTQVCYGIHINSSECRLALADEIGTSHMHGQKDLFLSIYLRKKEMLALHGVVYPLYHLQ